MSLLQKLSFAEGVEDEKTGILLLRLGCALAQRYFIAKPMPVAQFAEWFKQRPPIPPWVGREPWRLLVSDLPAATAGLVHQHMSEIMVESLANAKIFERPIATAHRCEFGQWTPLVKNDTVILILSARWKKLINECTCCLQKSSNAEIQTTYRPRSSMPSNCTTTYLPLYLEWTTSLRRLIGKSEPDLRL